MSSIQATGLTKRFGQVTAVDHVTFSVRPGEVTGFLGRNGAGKTTTLRMILGLDRPTSGTVTIDGLPYADLVEPLRHVGSLLDARAVQVVGSRRCGRTVRYRTRGRHAMVPSRASDEQTDKPSLGEVVIIRQHLGHA
jgi:ABC-2 type transport system ATP-binding protein